MSLWADVPDAPDSPTPTVWDLYPEAPDSDDGYAPQEPPELMDPQAIADACLPKRRPRISNNPKTIQATRLRAQKALVKAAKETGDDKLIAAALHFKKGREAFPHLAKKTANNQNNAILIERCAATLEATGRRNKMSLLKHLSAGLPRAFLTGTLGVSLNTLKRAREQRTHQTAALDFSQQQYAQNVRRVKVNEHEEAMLIQFFIDTTHVLSGAARETRNLEMSLHEWEEELYALYPTYLRRVAYADPSLLKENQGGKKQQITKFQASIRAAVSAAKAENFNVQAEQHLRRKQAQTRYYRKIAIQSGRLAAPTKKEVQAELARRNRAASYLNEKDFDPAQYHINGISFKTFLSVLASHDPPLRWTRYSSPHPCPLCDEGPVHVVVLDELEKEKIALVKEGKEIPQQLTQRLRKLAKKKAEYLLHKEQLLTARAQANKVRDNLAVGEVGVTRDFVNHHDHRGAHVKCLHFVLQWRDKEGAPLKLLKLRTYCSDVKSMSTDSYYVADAMDLHFKQGTWFNPFHRVYFFGDHGPHFASAQTLFNESTSYRRYKKEIHNFFFASYHAFGRADGAGAEDKRSARQDFRNGIPRSSILFKTFLTDS